MISNEVFTLGGIVILAVVIAAFVRNRGHNPALPLLIVGLAVGYLPIGPDAPTQPELVLVLVLAPLVFGEALSSSIIDLRKVSRPVMALAVGLVVFGAFVVGGVATLLLPGVPWTVLLCLGAILGPTDAVAVSATARSVALPRRLVNILEGESLVNDGTALTLLRVFALSAAAGTVTVGEVSLIMLESVVVGGLVGALGGLVLAGVTRRSRDTTVANGVILVAPFPIYAVAERFDGSGIFAVVVAALIVAHATSSAVTYTGRIQAQNVWRTVIFILQSVAFFLVGIEVPAALRALDDQARQQLILVVPVVLLALISARFVFVYGMTAVSGTKASHPRSWILLAWAGTRGPISALAALTLPLTTDSGAPFPSRDLIISITFCVVVLSLLLAPTTGPLARALRLPQPDDSARLRRVRTALARASLERLEELTEIAERSGDPIPGAMIDGLRAGAELRLDQVSRESDASQDGSDSGPSLQQLRVSMVHAEQEELLRLRDEEGLPDTLMRQIQKDLDARSRAARSG